MCPSCTVEMKRDVSFLAGRERMDLFRDALKPRCGETPIIDLYVNGHESSPAISRSNLARDQR